MSVMIKGMEMPKSCHDCDLATPDYHEGGYCCPFIEDNVYYNMDNRDKDCPLVELKGES